MSLQLQLKRSTVCQAVRMSLMTGRRAVNRSVLLLTMSLSTLNPVVHLTVTWTPLLLHLLCKTVIICFFYLTDLVCFLLHLLKLSFYSFRKKAPAKASKPKAEKPETSSKSSRKYSTTLCQSQIISLALPVTSPGS